MPIEFDEIDEIEEKQGGKGLRRKLEETLTKLATVNQEVATYRAEKMVREQGLTLVKADELVGVPEGEMKARAEALQKERQAQRTQIAREMLEARGLSGDELEAELESFLAPSAGPTDAFESVNDAAKIQGDYSPTIDPGKLHGVAAIEFALEKAGKSKNF